MSRPSCYPRPMCRNIRVLHHFEPPTTDDEIRAAALQFVRKVSGSPKAPAGSEAAFERAILEVTRSTKKLLGALPSRGPARTRDGERAKAKAKWQKREARMAGAIAGVRGAARATGR